MPRYKVTVVWAIQGSYDLDAFDEEEAINLAKMLPMPDDGEYLTVIRSVDEVTEVSNGKA